MSAFTYLSYQSCTLGYVLFSLPDVHAFRPTLHLLSVTLPQH